MVRMILVAIVALSLGVAAGVILLPGGADAMAGQNSGTARAELASLEKETETLREQVTRLDELNLTLSSQLEEMARERDDLKAASSVPIPAVETIAPEADAPAEDSANSDPSLPAEPPNWRDADGGRGGRNRDWGGTPEERRQAFERMRERMDEFMLDQIQNAPDKAAKDRIAQIAEYQQYMADLRQQLNETKDDTERVELREELREVQDASTDIVRDQQDSLIRDVAMSHGIKGEDDIAQFTSDMRAAIEDPFFRMGGFGGGRRGGFGGGGPGGGGRGPQPQ